MSKSNINSAATPLPPWDPKGASDSLEKLFQYIEKQSSGALAWYYRAQGKAGRVSRLLRFGTILFTALGGLVPVVATVVASDGTIQLRINQAGYICVGLAAFFLAYDRFSGSSNGWMRYMTAIVRIEQLVEDFRLDWIRFKARTDGQLLTSQQIVEAVDLLQGCSRAVRGIIKDETNAWIAEFQSNLNELEKQTQQAWVDARAQSSKDSEEERKRQDQSAKILEENRKQVADALRQVTDAQKAGAISLKVIKASTVGSYSVQLDGKLRIQDHTGLTCGIGDVAPGLHEVSVQGNAGPNGPSALVSTVASVTPNVITLVELELT